MRFGTLLVANRGEIAVRILRAGRAAGLRTVAVYSDADREAPHVREADTAVCIGPTSARDSYLSVPALLDATRRTGADALHPGYGFLSERAELARAVTDSGLVFVGPTADVIELMGRKDAARKVARAADVPVIPAGSLVGDEVDVSQIGFPLLVKAAAGGGGKGMRVVGTPEQLSEALAAARREALSAFGDDTLLVERYVERGRHVEVQVLADEHGHVVHLFERDCSVQRRHQKVLEEAPAPTIDGGLRAELTSAAVRLTRDVGYVNAGTVEFLVEESPASDPTFYFLEMNTRLQVEHPVTEAVTGRDLVQLQLAVAQGEALKFGQDEVTLRGHAIEARVYAEDPYAGFLPQAGVASTVAWPPRARVDAALESGQRVGTAYDPMLGKVIVHAATREAARTMLLQALDDTAILGLTTNVGFLRQLAASPAYRDAAIHTAWLDQHLADFAPETPPEVLCIAAWVLAEQLTRHGTTDVAHPFGVADGWRLAGPAAGVPVELDDRVLRVDRAGGRVDEMRNLGGKGGGGNSAAEEHSWRVRPVAAPPGLVRLELDDVLQEAHVAIDPHQVTVGHRGQPHVFARPDAFAPGGTTKVSDGSVAAPMPGTLLTVAVQRDQSVAAGDTLGVMEAMKMELALKAPYDGVVTQADVSAGDQVALGQTLFVVEPSTGE